MVATQCRHRSSAIGRGGTLWYLVGFGLSRLMWRKVLGCRSGGRVQSVTLRLVCAREAEIEAFVAREYWAVKAAVATEAGARFGINRAVALLADRENRDSGAKGPKWVLRELGPHPNDGAPVWLKMGHCGPFVAHRRTCASIPKDVAAGALTLERALALLGAAPGRRGRG